MRQLTNFGGGVSIIALTFALFLMIIFMPTSFGFYCPTDCNCFQRTVRCIRARLQTIPKLPSDAVIVDLRYNHFEELSARTFNDLHQVTTLFLNENEITYIQDSTFDGLNSLKFLYLNNNRLSRLPAKIFQALPQLEAIYLENNDIWQIDENTFDNLPRLNRIFLFNNKITNLPANAFTRLPSLKRLRLDGNPIACNCGIYSLWQHHQRHSQRQAITIALTCETPAALYRYTFTNLQEYHFHCKKPEILVAPHDIQAKIGETIELPCRMKGDPQPDIVWLQNTNEITSDYDATHKMQILPSGTLQIHAIENSDIGIYECIGRNEVGETHTQPIRLLVTNTNNNNEYKQVNNNQPDNQISNQLWNEQHTPQQQQQQQQKSQQQQQHQLLNSPISSRYTSQLVDNVENTGNSIETIGQHQQTPPPTQSTKAKPSKNIWQNQQQHEQANVYEKITTQGPPSAPHFLHTPQDHTVALNDEREVRLDCQAYGKPKPIINWYFNGRLITQSTNNMRIQTNGSLVIKPTTQQIAGNYRCEAKNQWGSIQATSFIDIKELPEILMAPQNQTVKIGQNFILECDADGNPIPIIIWLFNGTKIVTPEINAKANSNNNVAGITTSPTSTAASAMTAAAIPAGAIVNNGHLILENENTELIVNNAQESDRGIYTCIAENENGRTSVSATVIVERMLGMPRLLIEPFNLEAFTGTTIELPCKPDELKGVQINWRKDGRIIDPKLHGSFNVKYEISRTGSLFVKNVTILDGGRYECSVKNDFGRATASALIIIKDNINLAPGDRYVRIAFEEAAKEIDMAINNTIDMLFTKRNRANRPINSQPNYGELLRVFRFPNGEARQLARAAEIYERTLVNIRKHVLMGDNLTIESDKYEFRDLLSRDHLNLVAQLSGCMEHRQMPNCTDMCFHSKYRSIDGTCNNLMQPTWGASLTAFRRLEKPIYENGFSMPIGWMKDKLYSGFPKPSSRLVSTTLISTKENTPDNRITHMVMQWGQFLDHDLDHAIPAVSSESWDGIDCKKTCDFAPPCYPIEVPPNDPRVKNRRCIDLVRSSSICGSGMTSVFFNSIQHREQINQLTSYIDGSQVYGFSEAFANDLRNLTTDDGLLRVGVHFPNQREMLPFAAPQDGIDCRRNLDENQMNCFVAGDIRANEQVGLLAMHTIWMREHNRIATQLRYINPHWNGDTIYYEARKIVGAIMQHITYKYWLPIILGYSGMEKLGTYKGYNANLEPTISNEFATAALRFGHTLINPILHRLNATFQPISQGHLQLHKAFFAPWRLAYEGGVDPLMRGMFVTPAKLKKPDQNLNTELTEKLFQTAHAVALDLAAINIQRGRDHGIPSYNQYRQFCNLTVAHTFDDLSREISNRKVRDKLKVLYGHPDNIDLFVGGILEDQIHDAKVGPLFQCLLIEQFRRLRDGDRLYYENPQVFLPQQLEQIKQSNLARILCDNGDNIKEVTDNVFILPDLQDGYKSCDDIPGINLYLWQECSSCNSLPQLFDSYIPQIYPKKNRQNKREIRTKEAEVLEEYEPDMEMKLQELFDINEERVSGLEEVISSFQKEFKKLHRKIHKIEENCEASASNFNRGSNGNSVTNINTNNNNQNGPNENINIGKYKRNHCVDNMGTTRLNNEVWTPDYCTKCECRRNQISCMHEKCPELNCLPGVEAITPPMACCPHCMPLITKDKLIKT